MEDRTYHSTALLLPSGRVWSAGDDGNPFPAVEGVADTGEIYSPPYLFQGRRPAIARAPRRLRWDDAFGLHARRGDRPPIRRAVLMAPSAVTHATDMGQRLVPLRVRRRHGARGLDLISPPTPEVAPPGPYMLFGLSSNGTPSVASWVRLDPSAPDAATLGR